MSDWRPVEWLAWGWGVGGVVAVLLQAVVRLWPRAATVFDGSLTGFQVAMAVGWVAFMLYTEGWRGFHKQFSPRVIVRAAAVAEDGRAWLVLLAPAVAMGLLHATPRRLLVSRLLVAGIVLLVLLVRLLPSPWRAIVDLGVVLGLLAGTVSIVWFAVRAVQGRPPPVDAELPEAA